MVNTYKEGLKELIYFTEIHEQNTVNYHSKESTQHILHFIQFNIGIFCEKSLAGTSRHIGWVHATIIIIIIGQPWMKASASRLPVSLS